MIQATDMAEVYEVDPRPIYGATESRNRGNQWLANHQGRKQLWIERARARAWALWYVRGGMDPSLASPEARDAAVRERLRSSPVNGAEMAVALLWGWVNHHPEPEPEPAPTGPEWLGSLLERANARKGTW